MSNNKILISVKIPDELNQQLCERVIKDGYGMRGKSRWICEAIERFMELDDFIELIEVASGSGANSKTIAFRVEPLLSTRIASAIKQARTTNPMLDAVQSNLVRAGIYQRLIRG